MLKECWGDSFSKVYYKKHSTLNFLLRSEFHGAGIAGAYVEESFGDASSSDSDSDAADTDGTDLDDVD